jgi:hypothetical protein
MCSRMRGLMLWNEYLESDSDSKRGPNSIQFMMCKDERDVHQEKIAM